MFLKDFNSFIVDVKSMFHRINTSAGCFFDPLSSLNVCCDRLTFMVGFSDCSSNFIFVKLNIIWCFAIFQYATSYHQFNIVHALFHGCSYAVDHGFNSINFDPATRAMTACHSKCSSRSHYLRPLDHAAFLHFLDFYINIVSCSNVTYISDPIIDRIFHIFNCVHRIKLA